MSLIVVEASFTLADASRRESIVEASVEIQKSTRDEEPGCLAYCFAADPVEPDQIQVYELWESEAALAAHFEHPSYFAMRDMMAGAGIVRATANKHRVDASAPVYGPDMVATASFD